MCAMLYIIDNGCKWRVLPKEYGKCRTVYMKFNRWFKNDIIFRILAAMRKQKLLNKGNYVLFTDSKSIKVSPNTNRSQNTQDIESIYPKNNSYLLMDRAYEYDRTIALVKAHGFYPVVSPKKNRKLSWLYDKQLYKQRNIIERYFFRLKRVRKVFTR